MGTPKQDEWMQVVLRIPKERFRTPASTGTPAAKPPSAADKTKAVIAHAIELVKLAQDFYRATKAGASLSNFASGLQDPGTRVKDLCKAATKGAGEASALLNKGDVNSARKTARAAEAAGRQAHQLATDYAVALDHAAVTKPVQTTNTPWGMIALPLESSTQINNFIVPLTKSIELDKTALAQSETRSREQQKAVSPLIGYLTAPEKAAAEIARFASAKAVEWAEQSNTSKLLKDFVGHYKKTLESLVTSATNQLRSAQKQLQAKDLRDEVTKKREAAERASKLIDTIVDVLVVATKLLAKVEEGPGVAADIVGGLIKTFKTSDLLAQAKALEEQAGKLERESILIEVQSANNFILEMDGQLTTLAPLGGESADDAERKVIRAAKQFDQDCEKDPRAKGCKFRFHQVSRAQEATKRAVEAADYHCRTWMGADANRNLLVHQLDKFNYWFGDSRKTVEAARVDIQQHIADCQIKLKAMQQIGERLDLLFSAAITSLTKARQ
jgi:hypothetical protein